MDALELTDETQQKLDWRMRHFNWLLPRISGSGEDKEQFMEMWFAALDQAFSEGTLEAADLVATIRKKHSSPSAVLGVIENSIRELERRNRADR